MSITPKNYPQAFPFSEDLKHYSSEKGKADFISGLTVAIVAMPQAMAYAMIAGLAPVHGLYASILPVIMSALFGSSRYLVAGPTNALSMLVYSSMAQIYIAGVALNSLPETLRLQFLFLITILTGLVQCFAGFIRLGRFTKAISHSVILGFSTGAYLLIGLGQMKSFLGLDFSSPHGSLELIRLLISNLSLTNFYTFFIAIFTLFNIILFKKFFPKSPYALIALALSSCIHFLFDFTSLGVAKCPAVPQGLPSVFFPSQSLLIEAYENASHLILPVLTLALLASVESIAIGRSMAIERNQAFSTDQELIAGGLGNIVSGFTFGMPSCGSFSRSAVNFTSGAQTRFAAVWAGIFSLFALLIFGSFVAYIPICALSALLLYICYSMLKVQEIRKTLRASKSKASIFTLTFISVFVFGLAQAIFIGLFLSFLITNIRKMQKKKRRY